LLDGAHGVGRLLGDDAVSFFLRRLEFESASLACVSVGDLAVQAPLFVELRLDLQKGALAGFGVEGARPALMLEFLRIVSFAQRHAIPLLVVIHRLAFGGLALTELALFGAFAARCGRPRNLPIGAEPVRSVGIAEDDVAIETGKKVVGTTTSAKDVKEAEEHGWRVPPRMTTKDLRVAWCDHLNAEMERHGYEARFDQRRLKEQGIDRQPQIHVGPKASAIAEKGKTFESQDRRHGHHANVYSLIDTASRAEHNQNIVARDQQTDCANLLGLPISHPGRLINISRRVRENQNRQGL
jgi:hypothetical protein